MRLTKARREDLIVALRAAVAGGKSSRDIADLLGIERAMVYQLAHSGGISLKSARPRVMRQIPASMKPADLRNWRKGHGYTQPEAARLLGLSPRTYTYHETGTTRAGYRVPTVPRLVELAIKGLDAELRLVKYRMQRQAQDGKPLDPGVGAHSGHDDAGGSAGVAQVARPHPA